MKRALLIGLFVAAGKLSAENTAVLLPLSDLSGSERAQSTVRTLIAESLTRKGWQLADESEVERFLEEHRVRYLESLERPVRDALVARFNANAIVAGTILAYRETANPLVAVSARMILPDGTIAWGNVAALSAEESEGALGLGRHPTAESLAKEVVGQLLDLSRPRLALRRPVTYRNGKSREPRRVCILPFDTQTPAASRAIFDILTVRLASTGDFTVVEPADVRAALREEKLPSISAMTSAEMARAGARLGTTLFLRGNIYEFREAANGASEIQLDMTLADVATGEVLWAVTHHRTGAEYTGFLLRGTVGNIVALADRVLSEAVEAQHRKVK